MSDAWLPVETLIHEHQDEYYRVLNQSKDTNVGQNVGVKLTELNTEDKVLLLLKDNPRITAQGIADTMGKSKRQIERIIASLKACQKLERVGASKSGYWVVK